MILPKTKEIVDYLKLRKRTQRSEVLQVPNPYQTNLLRGFKTFFSINFFNFFSSFKVFFNIILSIHPY